MKSKFAFAATLLLAGFAWGQNQDNLTVSGILSDKGKPFSDGLVVLQHLKNEKCAKIFESNNPSLKEQRELESCAKDLPWIHTDDKGSYSYQRLSPGWYDIRFLWLMSEPPHANKQIVCAAGGWTVVFNPGKDHTGQYNGFAEGRPFQLKSNESKQINFDYQGQLNGNLNCLTGAEPPLPPGNPGKAQISFPGIKGVLEFDPGPTTWRSQSMPENMEIWLQAMERPDHLLVTAFLQKVSFTASPESCRDARWPKSEKRLREDKAKLDELKQTGRDGMSLVEFMLREAKGEKLQMRDIHGYLGSGMLCAEVHLSKVQFQPEDQRLFDEVLATVKLRLDESTDHEPDSKETEYLAEGSRLYLQRKYAAAVGPYEKALNMEKQRRRLSRDFFRVLVDNLGMSYGLSGNLMQAKETFEYGISQDPEYPLFYYNVACTYGEMGKMEESLEQLRLAYKYRANMIAGESMPDPLKDASFRNFTKNEGFVKAVRDMQHR